MTSLPALGKVEFDTSNIYPHGGPKGLLLKTDVSESSSGTGNPRDDAADIESQLAHESNLKRKKQTFTGLTLLWLSYQSLGVVYGDIGTSPLYVYSSTFTSNPSYDDLLGALSIIIWSLTLIVSVKYVCIVLHADDNGEGGTFALYSLIARYTRIAFEDPINSKTVKMERYATGDMKLLNRGMRKLMEKSKFSRIMLQFAGVVGVSLLMADGVLTPAQSVLGAIQGLRIIKPDLSIGVITGVSCAILVLLFVVQPFGITKIASSFAPIVIIWLLLNLVFGIYNLAVHDHTVLKAFSPFFAGNYLVRNGTDGWKSLGGLLLAFTGVEALFADLGAFGMRAVQISWLVFAYPCLLLAYIGQAAFISTDPTGEAWSNPFFLTVPPGTFYPSLVFSILAAIVASQAIITGTFQLLTQIMNLSFFPQLNVIHTSKKFHGQIYIHLANWILMIGTVIVCAVYNNTTNLGNAYGVCVIFVTFLTTCMVAIVALVVWRINFLIVGFVFLVFALLDGAFLSSVLVKVPQGAWLTLAIAFVLSVIFASWNYCKKVQWKTEGKLNSNADKIIRVGQKLDELYVRPSDGTDVEKKLANIGGMGVFLDKSISVFPTVAAEFFKKFRVRHDMIVFFHMRALNVPTIPDEERFVVSRTFLPNCFRFVIRFGYAEDVIKEDLGIVIYQQLKSYLKDEMIPNSNSEENIHIQETLEVLEKAYNEQVIYIRPRENFVIDKKHNLVKRYLLRAFGFIEQRTPTSVDKMALPYDQVIDIGYNRQI